MFEESPEPSGDGAVAFFGDAPPVQHQPDGVNGAAEIVSNYAQESESGGAADVDDSSASGETGHASTGSIRIGVPVVVPAVCTDHGAFSPPPKTSGRAAEEDGGEEGSAHPASAADLFADPVRGQGALRLFSSAPPTEPLASSSSFDFPAPSSLAFGGAGDAEVSFDLPATTDAPVDEDVNINYSALDASTVEGEIVMEGAFVDESAIAMEPEVETDMMGATGAVEVEITAVSTVFASDESTGSVGVFAARADFVTDDASLVEEIPLSPPVAPAAVFEPVAIASDVLAEEQQAHMSSSSDVSMDSASPSSFRGAASPIRTIDLDFSNSPMASLNSPVVSTQEEHEDRSDVASPVRVQSPSTAVRSVAVAGSADALFGAPSSGVVFSQAPPVQHAGADVLFGGSAPTNGPRFATNGTTNTIPATNPAGPKVIRVSSGVNLASADALFGGPSAVASDPFAVAPAHQQPSTVALRPPVNHEHRAADSLFGGPSTAPAATLFGAPTAEPVPEPVSAAAVPLVSQPAQSPPRPVYKTISPAVTSADALFSNPLTAEAGSDFGSAPFTTTAATAADSTATTTSSVTVSSAREVHAPIAPVAAADALFGGPSSDTSPFGSSTDIPTPAVAVSASNNAVPSSIPAVAPRPGTVVPKIIKGGVALRPGSDGASPFAAPAGDVSDLFGGPPSNAFGAQPAVDSLFAAPPRPGGPSTTVAPAAFPPAPFAATAKPSAQSGLLPATFFAAPAAAPSTADAFMAPPPGSKTALPSKTTSATDIFSRAAPVTAAPVNIDPFSPPVAPGVRIMASAPAPAVTAAGATSAQAGLSSMQSPTAGVPHIPTVTLSPAGIPLPPGTVAHTAPAATTHATTGESGRPRAGTKEHASAPAPVPEGMIPTPHGFVPAKPSASSAPAKPLPSAVPIPPQFAPGGVAMPPGVHAPTIGGVPGVGSSVAGHPSSAARFGNASTKGPSYRFPQPCSLVRFGFGGKVVSLMTRGEAYGGIGGQSSFTPTLGGAAVTARSVRPLPLRVYRLVDLVGRACGDESASEPQYGYKDVRKIELRRMLDLIKSFPGPLTPSSKPADVVAYIERATQQQPLRESLSSVYIDPATAAAATVGGGDTSNSSEHMLWALLRIIVDNNGTIQSENGLADPQSPESRILSILFQDAQARTAEASAFIGGGVGAAQGADGQPLRSAAGYAEIESLLLNGKRDDALRLAVEKEDFALALLIASVCGKEQFQYVSRCYADKNFAVTSSLHFMSMLYSNQAEKSLKHGGTRLLNAAAAPDAATGAGRAGGSAVVTQWRKHLAAIISNKNQNWSDLVRALAERILTETNDAALAHFVSITAGSLPSGSVGDGKFALVGCAPSKAAVSSVSDAVSLLGLRMSEIIEWAVCRGASAAKGSAGKASASSSISSSFTSLLGLGSAAKPPAGPKQAQQQSQQLGHVSMEQVLRMRGALCASKLRFAMWLADLGLVDAAIAYASDVRDTVRVSNASAAPKGPNELMRPEAAPSGAPQPSSPFTPLFCKSVDEFCDRLGAGKSAIQSKGSASDLVSGNFNETSSSSSGGGLWGGLGGVINNVLSSSNLKDFVDGPSSNPPTGQPPMNFPPTTVVPQRSGPPAQQQQPYSYSPGAPMGASMQQPPSMYPGAGMSPPAQHPFGSAPNAMPPSQPFASDAHHGMGGPAGVSAFGGYPNANAGAQQSQYNNNGSNQFQHQQHQQPHIQLPASQSSPNLSSVQTSNPTPPSKTSAATPTSPGSASREASSNSGGDSSSGVVHKVRKGLFKWLYPDAHDTTENMGNKLEAYFDKATGKWVFPGEENNPANDAAAAPPPIMPMMGAPAPAPAPKPTSPDDAGYDPLAALMAPPPRSVSMPSLSSMPGMPPGGPPGMPPMSMMGAPPSGLAAPPGIGSFAHPKPQVMAVPPFGGGGVAPFGAVSGPTGTPAVTEAATLDAAPLSVMMPPQQPPSSFMPAPHPFGFPAAFDPASTPSNTAPADYSEPSAAVPPTDLPPSAAELQGTAAHQGFGGEVSAPAVVGAPPVSWSAAPMEPPVQQQEWL